MSIDHSLIASASVTMNAPAQKVWDALTLPEAVKKTLFGTKLTADWRVGGEICFQGEYNGVTYKDTGTILQLDPPYLLQYTYLSSMSRMNDVPENYATVTYRIKNVDPEQGHAQKIDHPENPDQARAVTLTVSQKGYKDEQARKHAQEHCTEVLNSIKKLVETARV